ncbi:hypothetical protein DFP72DRAFT_1138344 [Ephemerocybe angulata]|uniref:Uncharacterized protein n=1 Tax=Ephemerocybe angulata TaxID=980116 RepID=A0A8H6HPN5_9AGAR|nr:hypothetical protein DFP72DRAFT_1138344 [Tulosesus angulatus]
MWAYPPMAVHTRVGVVVIDSRCEHASDDRSTHCTGVSGLGLHDRTSVELVGGEHSRFTLTCRGRGTGPPTEVMASGAGVLCVQKPSLSCDGTQMRVHHPRNPEVHIHTYDGAQLVTLGNWQSSHGQTPQSIRPPLHTTVGFVLRISVCPPIIPDTSWEYPLKCTSSLYPSTLLVAAFFELAAFDAPAAVRRYASRYPYVMPPRPLLDVSIQFPHPLLSTVALMRQTTCMITVVVEVDKLVWVSVGPPHVRALVVVAPGAAVAVYHSARTCGQLTAYARTYAVVDAVLTVNREYRKETLSGDKFTDGSRLGEYAVGDAPALQYEYRGMLALSTAYKCLGSRLPVEYQLRQRLPLSTVPVGGVSIEDWTRRGLDSDRPRRVRYDESRSSSTVQVRGCVYPPTAHIPAGDEHTSAAVTRYARKMHSLRRCLHAPEKTSTCALPMRFECEGREHASPPVNEPS